MKKIFLILIFIISFSLNAVGEQECWLCEKPMRNGEEIELSCGHKFHESCFDYYREVLDDHGCPCCSGDDWAIAAGVEAWAPSDGGYAWDV
jgi:hypothetical protein